MFFCSAIIFIILLNILSPQPDTIAKGENLSIKQLKKDIILTVRFSNDSDSPLEEKGTTTDQIQFK